MKQAKSLFGDIAKESIRMEMQQMIEKGVWKPISWSEVDTTVIPSKMFLKEKKDSNGVVTKIKARLVAGGHLQNREDLLDNSSPTLAYPSLLILSLLAAKFAHTVVTVDITGAYLNADMSDHVLMKINSDIAKYLIDIDPAYEAFQNEKGEIVVTLLKALYGCVQSSKLWYLTLKRLFIANGFKCSSSDECVFIKHVEGMLIVVAVYVDDITIQSESEELIEVVIQLLKVNFHEIKVNRGKQHQY
jgi:hypothetical protein